MAKRGSNIYKRKDGRFEGRVPVGYQENGKIKYKSVYTRTLSEVKEKISEVHSIRQNQPVSAIKLTVREAAEQWLSSAKLRVKESSYANYVNIVNKHILPILGGELMMNLTTGKLNDFINFKLVSGRLNGNGGLSAKSVSDIMTVYRSIENYAAREFGIKETHFTMPKIEKKQTDILTSTERKRLENYLINHNTKTHIAIWLCLDTGLRVGELCGLKWEDMDFDNAVLSVTRTVRSVSKNGKSQVIIETPKSKLLSVLYRFQPLFWIFSKFTEAAIISISSQGKVSQPNQEPCRIVSRQFINCVEYEMSNFIFSVTLMQLYV